MSVVTDVKMKQAHQQRNLLELAPKPSKTIYQTEAFHLWYQQVHALKNINLSIYDKEVLAIIGPSGCGKSSYLKSLNLMVGLVPGVKMTGKVQYRGENILQPSYSAEALRTFVGMVFQKPNPFPKSIFDNIAYGPRAHGIKKKAVVGRPFVKGS